MEVLKMENVITECKKEVIQIRIELTKKNELKKLSQKKNISISEMVMEKINEMIEDNRNGKQLKIEFN